MTETYTWAVTYQDESVLCEEEAVPQDFSSVDQKHVKSVSLLTREKHLAYCVDIPSGAQAICFQKRSTVLDPDNAKFGQTAYCIGWKNDESAIYLFVLANGVTLLTNDPQAV